MSRELKFRVWNKKLNKFTLGYDDDVGYFEEIYSDPPGIFFAGLRYLNKYSDGYIIQQYTGLNDKNNNPIYEGDVVARHHVDLVHKVEYLSNDYYKVEYCEKEAAYICRDCDGGFVYLSDFEYIVIGNRSEKPPCKFDHNFECMVCDGWPSDCPFVKFDKLK